MKLIIDIPDETYNYLKETWSVSDFDNVCTKVYNGIVNGIPLDNIRNAISEEFLRAYMYRDYANGLAKAKEIIDKCIG